MNSRLRLMLAGALAFASAGCAASAGGTSAGGTAAAPRPSTGGAVALGQGVRPTNNNQTKAADTQLNLAAAAATPEAAIPMYQVALDSANSAIRLDPNNPLAHKLAGQALIGVNRPMEAAAALAKAEELRPIYALETEGIRERGWVDQYQRAQPFLQSGDYKGAAEVLEGANALFQQRPEIMIVLGQIYAQENEADKAIVHLNRADSLIRARLPEVDSVMAVAWKENQSEIPVTIAQAYISAKRFDEAAGALRGLVEANPENTVYARNLASVYAQSAKPDSATMVYGRLLQRGDQTPSELYQIGIGLYTIENFAMAAAAFKSELQKAPKDRDAAEMWARTLQLAQAKAGTESTAAELDELARAGEAWLALDPNSRVGMLILAQTTNKAKNEARTQELVQKMEAVSVAVGNLQLRREADGGATLSGEIENYKANPGTPVTLTFTFYDQAGNALGTQTAGVTTGAKDAKSTFSVDFDSDKKVDGYTYTMAM